jgi:hypothetical protein
MQGYISRTWIRSRSNQVYRKYRRVQQHDVYEENSRGDNPIKNIVNGVVGAFKTVSDYIYERPQVRQRHNNTPSRRRAKNSTKSKQISKNTPKQSLSESIESRDDHDGRSRQRLDCRRSGRPKNAVIWQSVNPQRLYDSTRKSKKKKGSPKVTTTKSRTEFHESEGRDDHDGGIWQQHDLQPLDR